MKQGTKGIGQEGIEEEEVQAAMTDGNGHVTTDKGLKFERHFSSDGVSPYDAVEWEHRTASISSVPSG